MTRMARLAPLVLIGALLLAACDGDDPAEAPTAVTLTATEFAFDPDDATAAAGEITFEVVNDGAAEHNLTIEDANGDVEVIATVEAGASARGSATLEHGTYTFYCAIPGHREAGQEGTLTVEP